MSIARPFLIAALIAALTSGEITAAIPPQRSKSSPRAYEIPRVLAGVLLPESLQTILVIHLARDLTKAKANEIEVELRKTPDNLEDRLRLIGYYNWNGESAADSQRLRVHVLWVVENRPEHPASGEPILRDLPDDREGNAQMLALWSRIVDSRGDDRDVLKNAMKFFFGKDPERAETILLQLCAKEPTNPEWPKELANLYRIVGVPGLETNDPKVRALEAYKRVLSLTRERAAREVLAGDMADAAFKTGNLEGAAELSNIYLQSSDRAASHRAHTLLGRIALRSGDVASAQRLLLESSKPENGRYLSTFGPAMVLARELLESGERATVLQYLENCRLFWSRGETALNLWIEDVKKGRTPDFGHLGR